MSQSGFSQAHWWQLAIRMYSYPSEVCLKSYSTDACIQDAERRLSIMLARAEHNNKIAQVSIDTGYHALHACSSG